MIDFASLVLAHIMLTLLALKIFNRPDLNVEPQRSQRHFKQVGPKARAFEQTELDRTRRRA